MTTLDETLVDLLRARRKLDSEQGMVARRNARARFRRLLAQARTKLDAEYPIIKRKPAYKRKPNVLARLKEKNYVSINVSVLQHQHALVLSRLASARVKVVEVEREQPYGKFSIETFAPRWAIQLALARVAPEKISACRKDQELRKTLLVTASLKQSP